MSVRGVLFALSLTLLGPSLAHAQALPPTEALDRAPFAQGTWSLAASGAYVGGGDADIAQARAVVSFHVADRLAIGIAGVAYDLWREGERDRGGGADLLVRYYLFELHRIAPFLEAGVGVMKTGSALPAGGSDWNFTPQARAGIALELLDGFYLEAFGGWWHASNAGIEDQNPGYNGATAGGGLVLVL